MNIKDILAGGVAHGLKNAKHLRALQCLRWRQQHQGQESFHYTLDGDGTSFALQQIPNGEMKGLGTGTFVWPAAIVLAKYFEKVFSHGELHGKRICELGSGVGLNGIVAALLGAATVVLTDQDTLLPILQENFERLKKDLSNDARLDSLHIAPYDWNHSFLGIPQDGTATSEASPTEFDILIISDCVLPKLYPIALLVQAVRRLMSARTVAYFSYEHRHFPEYDPRQEFTRLCELQGMAVTVLPLADHHPQYCADDIELWTVRLQPSPCSSSEKAEADASPPSPLQCLTWGSHLSEVSFTLQGQRVALRQDASLGIGGVVWPTAVVLSRLLLSPTAPLSSLLDRLVQSSDRPPPLAVDLGAGCGLTAIALHRRGFSVLATDKPSLLPLLAENLHRNTPSPPPSPASSQLTVQGWDWTGSTNALVSSPISLVLASDCLYSSHSVQAFLQTLLSFPPPLSLLLANEYRSAWEEFLYLLRQVSTVAVEVTEVCVEDEDRVLLREAHSLVVAPPVRVLWAVLRPAEG